MSKITLNERVNMACGQDSNIVCARHEAGEREGFPEQYFDELGLSKQDLKRLERSRLALRGYKNDGRGNRTRWILVVDVDGGSDERKSE